MRRAASYGRAPVMPDVECAMLVLGYQGGCAPDFAEWRASMIDGAHHEYTRRRALVDAVPLDELRLAPSALGPPRRGGPAARARSSPSGVGLIGGCADP